MALNELSRHQLHSKLREALGEEATATLMEYLPPVGWADVATKRDLDALEERLGLRMEVLEQRLRADLRGEINAATTSHTRTVVLAVIGSNLTIAGVAFAAGLLR